MCLCVYVVFVVVVFLLCYNRIHSSSMSFCYNHFSFRIYIDHNAKPMALQFIFFVIILIQLNEK